MTTATATSENESKLARMLVRIRREDAFLPDRKSTLSESERLADASARIDAFFVPRSKIRAAPGATEVVALKPRGRLDVRNLIVGDGVEPRWYVCKTSPAIGASLPDDSKWALDPTAFRAVNFGRDLFRPLVSVRHVMSIGVDGYETSLLERCGVPLSRLDASLTKSSARLGPRQILHLASQMAWCVAALHAHGRAHGDVSANSFYLSPTSEGGVEVTLGDFEWACSATTIPLFAHDRRLGYPSGCSPPEFAFDGPCGIYECFQGDVWACGAAAWRLLVGELPDWCSPDATVASDERETKARATRRLARLVSEHREMRPTSGEDDDDIWPRSELPVDGDVRWSDAMDEMAKRKNDKKEKTLKTEFEEYAAKLETEADKKMAREVLLPTLLAMLNPVPGWRPTALQLVVDDSPLSLAAYDTLEDSISTKRAIPLAFFEPFASRLPMSTATVVDRRDAVRTIATRTTPVGDSIGLSRLVRFGLRIATAADRVAGPETTTTANAASDVGDSKSLPDALLTKTARDVVDYRSLGIPATTTRISDDAGWIRHAGTSKMIDRVVRNLANAAREYRVGEDGDARDFVAAHECYRSHPDVVPNSRLLRFLLESSTTEPSSRAVRILGERCKRIYEMGYEKATFDDDDPSPGDVAVALFDEVGGDTVANALGEESPSIAWFMSAFASLAYSKSAEMAIDEASSGYPKEKRRTRRRRAEGAFVFFYALQALAEKFATDDAMTAAIRHNVAAAHKKPLWPLEMSIREFAEECTKAINTTHASFAVRPVERESTTTTNVAAS